MVTLSRIAVVECVNLSEGMSDLCKVLMAAGPPMQNGPWEDVSGDTFLRTLLSMPIQGAKFDTVRDSLPIHSRGLQAVPKQASRGPQALSVFIYVIQASKLNSSCKGCLQLQPDVFSYS